MSAATAANFDVTGPIPDLLAISTYAAPATQSITPTRRDLTWPDLATMLNQHERRPTKDGPGWSPTTYRPGTTRANKNVVEVSAAVGDFDKQTVDDLRAIWRHLEALGLTYCIYSTWSSRPDKLAFRVVIPFSRPVPREQA